PPGDLGRRREGKQGVHEDPLSRTGDHRAAGRRPGRDLTLPELIGTGVWPHRGDVHVNRKRTAAHLSLIAPRSHSAAAVNSAMTLSSRFRATTDASSLP